MFGHKQLPAYASCVSSELARILQQQCIRVIGLMIDDFLFLGPASEGPEGLSRSLKKADALMTDLNLPPNDKGQGPATSVVFAGIKIDTIAGHLTIDEEQRQYCIHRLAFLMSAQRIRTKDLESLHGSLGWLCYVCTHGRSHRDIIAKAALSPSTWTDMSKPLRNQLRWWHSLLSDKKYKGSRIFFRNEQPKSLLIKSDASGDHGFGFCAAGLHVFGTWSPNLAQIILHDMFVKELIPVSIAVLLLTPWFQEYILGVACDNSGVVFRINCGSCKNPLGLQMFKTCLQALHDADTHLIADWNNREQLDAQHADDTSKAISRDQWLDQFDLSPKPWIFQLVIHDLHSDTALSAKFRLPRLAQALPATSRHPPFHPPLSSPP